MEPVYKEFEGWKCDITSIRNYDELPDALKRYIAFIEEFTGCPVDIVSVGPDRSEVILR